MFCGTHITMDSFLNIIGYFGAFCILDNVLSKYTRLEGIYYLLHAAHNGLIVKSAYKDVLNTWTGFGSVSHEPNMYALELVFALHFYHLCVYWRKFRFDDWLHHILMIGIALPVGGYFPSGSLLGYGLFFTTGLPGGIDYALLFLVRNGWLNRTIEKRINAWLNVWVRSPGCASHACFTFAYVSLTAIPFTGMWWAGMMTGLLTYWNGQYFMRQVVENALQQDHAV